MPRARAGRPPALEWAPECDATNVFRSCLELVRLPRIARALHLMKIYAVIAYCKARLAYCAVTWDEELKDFSFFYREFDHAFRWETGRAPRWEEAFAWCTRHEHRTEHNYDDRAERSEDDRRSLVENLDAPEPEMPWEYAQAEPSKKEIILKTGALLILLPWRSFLLLQASAYIMSFVLPKFISGLICIILW